MVTKAFFHGRKDYRLDPKGRIPFPSAWYAPLGLENCNKVVVAKGLSEERYLEIFSVESWEEQMRIVDESPIGPARNKMLKWYIATAETVELDNQNRIRLSKNLIDYADIKKDVVLAGSIETAQIWAKEVFDASLVMDDADFDVMYNFMNDARKKIREKGEK